MSHHLASHRPPRSLHRLSVLVLAVVALAAACSPVGGGASSVSGSSSHGVFHSQTATVPFCSVLGGPVRARIAGNEQEVRGNVVLQPFAPIAWQDGSEVFAVGGATKTSMSVPAGSCGTIAFRTVGNPFCDFDCESVPDDHVFSYTISW